MDNKKYEQTTNIQLIVQLFRKGKLKLYDAEFYNDKGYYFIINNGNVVGMAKEKGWELCK